MLVLMQCFLTFFGPTVVSLPVERRELYKADLKELATVLQGGLAENFAHVDVEVIQCPDLSFAPFYLASKGLGGSTRLAHIGDKSYVYPVIQREKIYEMREITKLVDMQRAFIVGSGMAPYPHLKSTSEGIYNLNVVNGSVTQHTRICTIDKNEQPVLFRLADSDSKCAYVTQLFFSEGRPGKVVKVHVKKRTGEKDFVTAIRTTLANFYGNKVVGLGGTFLIKEGWVNQAVIRDHLNATFFEHDFTEAVNFYNLSALLVAVGSLVSKNIDELNLDPQHFHSFGQHYGGHYFNDITPDIVEYLGYFNVAESIYRIDHP